MTQETSAAVSYDLKEYPSDEEIAGYKAQYPGIELLAVHCENEAIEVGWFVFRKPTRAEYNRFRAQYKTDQSTATDQLSTVCVVRPSRSAFAQLLELYPGIITACGDAACTLAGVTVNAETKKL